MDQLEQLVRDQVRMAGEKAAETGGVVPTEQMDSIMRLKGLLDISRSLARARHRRWPAAATLIVALLLVSFLFFDRMTSASRLER